MGTPLRRVLTGLVLVAFTLQLGRFYLAASANQDWCPEQPMTQSGDQHHGHSHDEAQLPASLNPEGGPYFQHCKEHVYNIGLTHAQTLAEPEDVSLSWAPVLSMAVPTQPLHYFQNDLTTPFHPPRHFS